ncbi:MAG: tetratricopeptide repeat protein [Bacteroidales bacterium]|nr:tetratricopeptide repeat protein [Bacteroidales bacterium]
MKKNLKYILLFILLCNISFAQDTVDVSRIMKKAVYENDFQRAYKIYSTAKEENYYNMESLERILCQIKYLEKDYENAKYYAQKLYNEDENDFLTDIIQIICWAKKKNNNELIGERIQDILQDGYIPNTILQDMKTFPKSDFKNLSDAVSSYIKDNKITEKEDLYPFRTLLTLLFFCQDNYMQCYNAGIELISENNSDVIYYILGFVREKRHEYNSAIAFYNLSIKKGFKDYDVFLHRAICKGQLSAYESSNKDLDTCLSMDTNYYALFLKGINYNYLQEYKKALYCFNLSLNLNDTFSPTYNYRGIVYANLKEYDFAVLDFRLALKMNPKTAFAHNNLGISLEKTGKVQDAINEYLMSVKMEPDFFDAYYNLGRNYTYQKKYKKAVKYLNSALLLEQQVPDIYYLLGINYAHMEKKEKACSFLQQALSMGHTEAEEKIKSYCENNSNIEIEQDINFDNNSENIFVKTSNTTPSEDNEDFEE